MSARDREAEVRARFEEDTARHQMTVLRDDDGYRHLRFKDPEAIHYYFDIVTWPGYLAIVGDAGDFVFSRVRDMFTFFESESGRINPDYWAQKLQAPRGTKSATVFTFEAFKECLYWWAEDEAQWNDIYPSLIKGAVDRELLDGRLYYEDGAYERLRELEEDGIIYDAWEWNLREFDWQFLWCCMAIVWGIGMYRAHDTDTHGLARVTA